MRQAKSVAVWRIVLSVIQFKSCILREWITRAILVKCGIIKEQIIRIVLKIKTPTVSLLRVLTSLPNYWKVFPGVPIQYYIRWYCGAHVYKSSRITGFQSPWRPNFVFFFFGIVIPFCLLIIVCQCEHKFYNAVHAVVTCYMFRPLLATIR